MHELSIAQSILETVQTERQREGWGAVQRISLQIGALAGIHTDSLSFGFEALRGDYGLGDCQLDIEAVPLTLSCAVCGTETPSEDIAFACTRCGSHDVSVVAGYELDIASVEVAEDAPLVTASSKSPLNERLST